MDLVAVDIGGTHARFAIASVSAEGRIALGEPETLHTKDHASFQTAWEDFRERRGGSLPARASLSVAAPVGGPENPDQVIRFTNNPWLIRPTLMQAKLGVDTFSIVNDFAAVAHAAARAPDEQLLLSAAPTARWRPPAPSAAWGRHRLGSRICGARASVITGSPNRGRACRLRSRDSIEDAILARLRNRHTPRSIERVVSGPAIRDIYPPLAATRESLDARRRRHHNWTRGLEGGDASPPPRVRPFLPLARQRGGRHCAGAGGFRGVVIAGGSAKGYATISAFGLRRALPRQGRFAELMAASRSS